MGTEIDIFKIILSSGPIAKLVLLVLLFGSVYSWALIFKKLKAFKKVNDANKEFLDLYNSSTTLSYIYDKTAAIGPSTFKLMFNSAYADYHKTSPSNQKVIIILERSMKQSIAEVNNALEHHLSILASIGSVSPYIGLFGTVWGIIASFQGLSMGGGNIEMIAPGIAEALVATALGILVAIPAVWFFNYFHSKITSMNANMDSFALDFLNKIELGEK